MTSDGGGLLLRHADRALGLIERVAACFVDGREQDQVVHGLPTLVGQRIVGIALGYEDVNDHDELRHDPVLAVLAGKLEARRAELCAAGRQEHAQPAGACAGCEPTRYHKIGHDAGGDRAAVRRSVPRGAQRRRRSRSSSTSTPPTIRCTAIRRAGSSTATTTATAICRSTCSAAGTCSRPSCGARTSTPRPAPSRRSSASSARSARAGRGSRSCCAPTRGFAREELMAWCEANRVDYVFGLARNERLVGADRRASWPRPRPRAWPQRPAGPALQGVLLRARWTAGAARAGSLARPSTWPRGQPALHRHLAAGRRSTAGPCTSRSIAPAARWRTGSRSSSSICSPIARPRRPCGPTSSGCGSRRSPMCCSRPCGASACATPSARSERGRGPLPNPTGNHDATCGTIRLKLLKLGAKVTIRCAGSRSPWPRPARIAPSSRSPICGSR